VAEINGKRDGAAIALLVSTVLAIGFVIMLGVGVFVNLRQDSTADQRSRMNCQAINDTRAEVLDLARRGTPEVRAQAETALQPIDC
jgi:hypothetical protein